MYSTAGHDFNHQLGFANETGQKPGFSAFRLASDGSIVRTGSDGFGPGDLYNAAWPMFEHLADGAGDWKPK
jgi:hypothetical protein